MGFAMDKSRIVLKGKFILIICTISSILAGCSCGRGIQKSNENKLNSSTKKIQTSSPFVNTSIPKNNLNSGSHTTTKMDIKKEKIPSIDEMKLNDKAAVEKEKEKKVKSEEKELQDGIKKKDEEADKLKDTIFNEYDSIKNLNCTENTKNSIIDLWKSVNENNFKEIEKKYNELKELANKEDKDFKIKEKETEEKNNLDHLNSEIRKMYPILKRKKNNIDEELNKKYSSFVTNYGDNCEGGEFADIKNAQNALNTLTELINQYDTVSENYNKARKALENKLNEYIKLCKTCKEKASKMDSKYGGILQGYENIHISTELKEAHSDFISKYCFTYDDTIVGDFISNEECLDDISLNGLSSNVMKLASEAINELISKIQEFIKCLNKIDEKNSKELAEIEKEKNNIINKNNKLSREYRELIGKLFFPKGITEMFEDISFFNSLEDYRIKLNKNINLVNKLKNKVGSEKELISRFNEYFTREAIPNIEKNKDKIFVCKYDAKNPEGNDLFNRINYIYSLLNNKTSYMGSGTISLKDIKIDECQNLVGSKTAVYYLVNDYENNECLFKEGNIINENYSLKIDNIFKYDISEPSSMYYTIGKLIHYFKLLKLPQIIKSTGDLAELIRKIGDSYKN